MSNHHFSKFIVELKQSSELERQLLVEKFLKNKETPIIEPNTVHFIYYGNASEVKISGDLQSGWSKKDKLEFINCGNSKLFFKSYIIPSNARLDYKFEVDGNHINDPLNPKTVPSGYGHNSELAMPEFNRNQSLIAKKNIEGGIIEKVRLQFKSNSMNTKELKVYLPPNYNELLDIPCIYVLDGDDMLNFAFYKNVLDNCINSRKIEPIVAVFIPTEDRSNEYLYSKKTIFMDAMLNELIPEIEKNFKVADIPEARALHGISAGGYYSLCSIFKHPHVFSKVAAQSSAIKTKLFNIFADTMKNGGVPETSKIYIDVGRYDLEIYNYDIPWIFIDVNRKLSFELQRHGITHKYNEFNDGHSWANWRERTEEILIYFFGGD